MKHFKYSGGPDAVATVTETPTAVSSKPVSGFEIHNSEDLSPSELRDRERRRISSVLQEREYND